MDEQTKQKLYNEFCFQKWTVSELIDATEQAVRAEIAKPISDEQIRQMIQYFDSDEEVIDECGVAAARGHLEAIGIIGVETKPGPFTPDPDDEAQVEAARVELRRLGIGLPNYQPEHIAKIALSAARAAAKVEPSHPTCKEFAYAMGHDQAKTMGIPLSDEPLSEFIKRRDAAKPEEEPNIALKRLMSGEDLLYHVDETGRLIDAGYGTFTNTRFEYSLPQAIVKEFGKSQREIEYHRTRANREKQRADAAEARVKELEQDVKDGQEMIQEYDGDKTRMMGERSQLKAELAEAKKLAMIHGATAVALSTQLDEKKPPDDKADRIVKALRGWLMPDEDMASNLNEALLQQGL